MSVFEKVKKLFLILRYGLIYDNKKYNITGFAYNEYIDDYVFFDDQEGYFCFSDIDKFEVANR